MKHFDYSLHLKFVFLVLLLAFASPGTLLAETLQGRVVGIADGDTLTLLDGGNRQHKIRLAEIDAPEVGHGVKKPGQPWGQNSRQSLAVLCYRKQAAVSIMDIDRYGRSVGRVVCEGKDANLVQVSSGMAWAYERYNRRPEITKAEKDARAAKRGLWADVNNVPPWDWRKQSLR